MKRVIQIIMMLALSASLLTGCGGSNKSIDNGIVLNDGYAVNSAGNSFGLGISNKSYDTESAYIEDSYSSASYEPEYEAYEQSEQAVNTGSNSTEQTRDENLVDNINYEKLVYRANLDIETLEFNKSLQDLKDLIAQNNGIIQGENYRDNNSIIGYGYRSGRTIDIAIRIPTPNYNTFISTINNVGKVRSQSSTVENISQEYYNTKAYLDSYKTQLDKLQEMYEYAETIEEMITIESRIAEVNAEILRLTTKIQSMDLDVAYSTVDIRLEEVVEYSKDEPIEGQRTFIDRLKATIKESIENLRYGAEDMLFWFILHIWELLIIVFVVFIAIKVIKARIKHHKKTILNGNKIKLKKNDKNIANSDNDNKILTDNKGDKE